MTNTHDYGFMKTEAYHKAFRAGVKRQERKQLIGFIIGFGLFATASFIAAYWLA